MKKLIKPLDCLQRIVSSKKILIIQDLDGVCIPLVKDPLQRKINSDYIYSSAKLNGEFFVLTCGEHEGRRGVNRLIETAIRSETKPLKEGLYLPGLASCGVEFQDSFGNVSYPGVNKQEIEFLRDIPLKMEKLLRKELTNILPGVEESILSQEIKKAICDTRFTPTLNLNGIFDLVNNNLDLQIKLQLMMEDIMNKLINSTKGSDLEDSFYLHIMPNLGKKDGKELIKFASEDDIGSTDIQFILNGAVKESGLLFLLNKYLYKKTGAFPFGENFNVRSAPKKIDDLIKLCLQVIPISEMPLLVGVGDTVTSNQNNHSQEWLRGGSDRGFLTLIQELGKAYNQDNQTVFVNSCNDEVYRPSASYESMRGIIDTEDPLQINCIMTGGPKEYLNWFQSLANERYPINKEGKNKNIK